MQQDFVTPGRQDLDDPIWAVKEVNFCREHS